MTYQAGLISLDPSFHKVLDLDLTLWFMSSSYLEGFLCCICCAVPYVLDALVITMPMMTVMLSVIEFYVGIDKYNFHDV
jgi:hypothetical protein